MVGSLLQSAVLPALHGSRAQGRRLTKTHAIARVSVSKLQVHSRPLRFSGSRVPHTFFLGTGSILPGQTMRPARKQARSVAVRAMFERFTQKACKVITLAIEEARQSGHYFVETEHILLGLIGEDTGIAAEVLKSMGINLKDARVEVEKVIGRGSGFVPVDSFAPCAKQVLELSLDEARQLGHNYVGSEHLLLGLLREEEGVPARVLETLGADPSNIRTQVIKMVEESTEDVGAGVERLEGFQEILRKDVEEARKNPELYTPEERENERLFNQAVVAMMKGDHELAEQLLRQAGLLK